MNTISQFHDPAALPWLRKAANLLSILNCPGLRAGLGSPMGKIKSKFLSEIEWQFVQPG
jgi:hypothetical protein